MEGRDRQGYLRRPQAPDQFQAWEAEANMAGGIARGDVRVYQFASPGKKRPVVVLTRDSAIGYLSTVTVAPIASTIRGVPSEVILNEDDGMKTTCAVNLHHAITVSQHRLGKRVAHLTPSRMCEICAALRFSLGCDLRT